MKQNATYPPEVGAAVAMFEDCPCKNGAKTDKQIKSLFEKTYVYRIYLKNDSVKIEAKDCVATLTGVVAEESHKILAQETMANLPGVNRVDNQLAILVEVADESTANWIGSKVKLILRFHRSVNGENTIVAVKDGVVTLTGEAASIAMRELTAEYAVDIKGVKVVKSEMTVAATPDLSEQAAGEVIDDASVTAMVKVALLGHRSTSGLSIQVNTLNGEVRLSGMADKATEKSQVTNLVTDIRGVISVKNLMTVAEIKAV